LLRATAFSQEQESEYGRAISADMALRPGIYFGLPAQFWRNLRNEYDLRRAAASPALKKLTPRTA
jgi:plasmid maintenance system antidote protein VapI